MGSSTAQEQADFHEGLFGKFYGLNELPADSSIGGLDQMGHFGQAGCDLLVKELTQQISPMKWRGGPSLMELGSGIGGTLRAVRERFRADGFHFGDVIGVDIVLQHAIVATRFNRRADPRSIFLVGDCASLPIASASQDVIFSLGSASHFAAMGNVLVEVARTLAPDGVACIVEEVSIVHDPGLLPDDFARLHPPEIFSFSTLAGRRQDFRNAKLRVEVARPLSDWAVLLLRKKRSAMRIFGRDLASHYGVETADRISAIQDSVLDAYSSRAVIPMLFILRPCETA